ncbi:hypothetical protein H0H87_008047 [Tephrocybe sp. NHM501043]|nr:hypothetical protein H0H87_008047 [Tephrocybe sp. NHM501043]
MWIVHSITARLLFRKSTFSIFSERLFPTWSAAQANGLHNESSEKFKSDTASHLDTSISEASDDEDPCSIDRLLAHESKPVPSAMHECPPQPHLLMPITPNSCHIDKDTDQESSALSLNDAITLPGGIMEASVLYPSINLSKKILLTFRLDPHNTAERHYDEACLELARFPFKDTLRITVSMIADDNWSEKGLETLGDGLARLAKADVAKNHRCNWLSVILPRARPPPLGAAPDTLLTLPALKRLYWHTHRFQLPLLHPETSFSNITSLYMRCNITTRDCAFLLTKCPATLTTATFRTLFDDATKSVLPDPTIDPGKLVTMASLTFLTIRATCNIGPMLNQFDLPRLQKVNFDILVYMPHFTEDFKTIQWQNLQETSLKCDFSRDDPRWIEARIEKQNPRGYHNHVHRHYPVESRPYIPIMT